MALCKYCAELRQQLLLTRRDALLGIFALGAEDSRELEEDSLENSDILENSFALLQFNGQLRLHDCRVGDIAQFPISVRLAQHALRYAVPKVEQVITAAKESSHKALGASAIVTRLALLKFELGLQPLSCAHDAFWRKDFFAVLADTDSVRALESDPGPHPEQRPSTIAEEFFAQIDRLDSLLQEKLEASVSRETFSDCYVFDIKHLVRINPKPAWSKNLEECMS